MFRKGMDPKRQALSELERGRDDREESYKVSFSIDRQAFWKLTEMCYRLGVKRSELVRDLFLGNLYKLQEVVDERMHELGERLGRDVV